MLKKLFVLAIVAALGVAACSSGISLEEQATENTQGPTSTTTAEGDSDPDAEPTATPTSSGVTTVAALQPFAECAAYLAYVKSEAIERVTPWGLDGGFSIGFTEFEGDLALEESTDDAAASGGDVDQASSAPVQGEDFSGTNVQVAGVDEPDIVKTDGARIVSLVDGVLTITDVSGTDAEVIGTLRFDEIWPQEMLLSNDSVIIFGSGGEVGIPVEPLDGVTSDFQSYGPTASIVKVDISGAPEIESVLTVEGNYLSARSIDGVARVAISSPPLSLPFLYPSTPAGEEAALEANKDIIADSDLSHWMADYTLETMGGSTTEGQLVDCSQVHRPAEFSGFEMLSVLTVDIDGALTPGSATGVVASGETIYASGENFYVGTNRWAEPVPWDAPDAQFGGEEFEESYTSDVHKFSITSDEPADYQASGEVRGHALNQFAFHEWDGHLFVTTTDGSPWGFNEDSESYLTSLEQLDNVLVKVGQVGDMGRGERVYSVRYIADQAYIVTFRQVDPLYIVDLSDPTDPTVTGELKIPGYSSYLHPVGDDLLLGVGQDATEDGRTTGAKVSLFDVSDPTDPKQRSTWTMPGASTDVEWDHRAFLYWEPEQMAVLPLQDWQNGFTGAVVLGIDGTGLTERGRIDHAPDDGEVHGSSDCIEIDIEDPEVLESFPEIVILICDDGAAGGAVGYYCDIYDAEEAATLAEEFGAPSDSLDLEEHQRLEVCWPDSFGYAEPILRSLVIDDELWTLSRTLLQANDITTLDRTQRVG
jgi:hypothetical protein